MHKSTLAHATPFVESLQLSSLSLQLGRGFEDPDAIRGGVSLVMVERSFDFFVRR